jgi:hypothetical protein
MPEDQDQFKTWAIVEVMGHKSYSGFVTAETIAGAAMLRIDVPECGKIAAFTKYLSMGAIYGISPCTEATARAQAKATKSTPFETWGVEQMLMDALKEKGALVEHAQIGAPKIDYEHEPHSDDDDDEDCDTDF